MAVNNPRPCIICGREFYPSLSGSLFICGETRCKEEFDGAQEECHNNQGDMNDDRKGPA